MKSTPPERAKHWLKHRAKEVANIERLPVGASEHGAFFLSGVPKPEQIPKGPVGQILFSGSGRSLQLGLIAILHSSATDLEALVDIVHIFPVQPPHAYWPQTQTSFHS